MTRAILVPVHARSSLAAIDRALALAAVEGARVTALGLVGRPPIGMVPVSAPDGSTVRRRAELAAALRETEVRARRRGTVLEVIMRSGSPDEAIRDESQYADLIVLEESVPWLSPRARERGLRKLRRCVACTITTVASDAAAHAAGSPVGSVA